MRGATGRRHGGQRVFVWLVPRALDFSPECTQLAVWPWASLLHSSGLSFLIRKMKVLVGLNWGHLAKAGDIFGCYDGPVMLRVSSAWRSGTLPNTLLCMGQSP